MVWDITIFQRMPSRLRLSSPEDSLFPCNIGRLQRARGLSLAKFHVDAIQRWEPFEHAGASYGLGHLDCHEIFLQKEDGRDPIRFVVTYGLHCFTKDDTEQNIPLKYADGRERRFVCIERYETSKNLRGVLEKLASATVFLTQGESFFTIDIMNNSSGEVEPFKICMAIFRENRVLRIHVTSAYFARLGEGSPGVPIKKKGFSIFKIVVDTLKKPNGQFPKEVRNRHPKRK